MEGFDFLEMIGEGAFFVDEENETINPLNEDEHPTDVLIRELEEV